MYDNIPLEEVGDVVYAFKQDAVEEKRASRQRDLCSLQLNEAY